MDLRALREAAIEATARALLDRHGVVPDEESDEWETEYPRQFALMKRRYETEGFAPGGRNAAAPAAQLQLPALIGTPEQQRWAATVREDRLAQLQDRDVRAWLAVNWTRAKAWIDTRDLPPETFRARARVWHADGSRQSADRSKIISASRQSEQAAAAAIEAKIAAAGITAEGLIELIDASERADPAPLAAKLAEITLAKRNLRIFETSDPNVLLVKEKSDRERLEYGIESDDGLVADLKLFAQLP